ncbi:MAG: hypothetical protein RMJ15_02795 [Nitrososphaerota archaeon]|nr:hypothetical protein [Candidatus Bathyarchaeota archaeon]MDW8022659.1 hypothetical protein [Nitrososphaerota archaeon]
MRIIVSKFGNVCNYEVASIVGIIEECYSRLAPHDVSLVDLYVFERASSAEAFLAEERGELGVSMAPFDELFFARHDAWRGTPRIVLCLEKLMKLPELVKVGGIRHEVGHTVLHGSLQYYLLPFPPSLLEMAKRFSLPAEYSRNILYLVSIAVKDYEVTRLLYQRGYVEDQEAFAKFLLKTSEEDVFSWKLSRGKPLLEALCLISHLKALGCAAPFLADEKLGADIRQRMEESIHHLPRDLSTLVLKILDEGFGAIGTDTLSNIDHVMRKCNLIFEALLSQR